MHCRFYEWNTRYAGLLKSEPGFRMLKQRNVKCVMSLAKNASINTFECGLPSSRPRITIKCRKNMMYMNLKNKCLSEFLCAELSWAVWL